VTVPGDHWLYLKISDTVSGPANKAAKTSPRVLISVPKKLVRLATERNRLKRLVREAVRKDAFFKAPRVYYFRVLARPTKPGLSDVQRQIVRSLR